MRNLLFISVMCGMLLLNLGCQAEKELEQCQFTQQGLESSLGECEQAKSVQEAGTAEIIEHLIMSSREGLAKCNTEWAAKLKKSQQELTQIVGDFKNKAQGMQQELQKVNETNQTLQAELREVKKALVAATEKNKAADVEIEKLSGLSENKASAVDTK